MVDRITPNTSAETLTYLGEKYGILDQWAVSCEDYIQWVLEDKFKLAPSGLDPRLYVQAGVQIVKDVEPYELMKMRLLNGSHSALAYPAYLMGYTGVAEAVEDPVIQRFIRQFYMEEITATLSPVPGIDLSTYKDTLIKRFTNRNIADAVLRLAEDGSKKIPNAILKPLGETIKARGNYRAIAAALAGWARFLSGTGEDGKPIPIKDPDGQTVIAAAQTARTKPDVFLQAAGFRSPETADFAQLTAVFKTYLESFYTRGARKTLEEF
jgi:mannitol 2-dehydrogenase